ncbi:MAG: 2-oxoglutarate dehydrogenase complex dihydrolipoyllysine-residue succinyltransferase [Deltaproteobacteria bacterium]|nr:2-oxoglutarate dehydrogenase complex dihydrolipoyllysine-residue succinyltransferase [Deltaproteobacteria bacterium]
MKHDVVVPSAGESVTEVFIGTWRKKTGDFVKKDEVLVDLETQKATFEIQAEYSGRIEILKPDPQTKVKPGDVIASIDDSAKVEAVPSTKVSTPTPAQSPQRPPVAAPAPEPVLSPAARKIVVEKRIEPSTVVGTGKGGRILKEDVIRISPPPSPVELPVIEYRMDTERGEVRKPVTQIRKQIAKNLVAAQQIAAILTTFNEVDMSAVMAFRNKYKESFKQRHGVSLGMVGVFAMAAARALKEFPVVNSMFAGEEIISRNFVDLSIAVSTERGLVVPVVRDVQSMNLSDFEKKLHELTEKARGGKLSIPEMTGGTFTVSNGGVFGSLLSTPILNTPQSAILGLHKIEERPVVVNGQIVIRPMMYLALSYDHRLIDGREAVLFLVKVKEGIENIDQMVSEKDL